ncbi:hypothetical protein CAPTEDRAFT_196517 [Capitella teleta]|uniref:WSC domain-containing protein n=1 Tax=Capitella teleta TaxID=283909 RepID=R7V4N2_CAPTE|nr:hypothetical protein CAPTEDRAFT_196517 [Capitella teleta]|eukprot:ELU13427.1 hypothetical protein CAPTEDRAFT_196517 [Capitella teleta]
MVLQLIIASLRPIGNIRTSNCEGKSVITRVCEGEYLRVIAHAPLRTHLIAVKNCVCMCNSPDQFVGCFLDSNQARRTLPFEAYRNFTFNSNDGCIKACSAVGYTFAGTETIIECRCGNNYDYDQYGEEDVTQCTLDCQGNPSQTCGGNWRVQLYSVCPAGKYKGAGDALIGDKPNCENECHCSKARQCLYTNGTCPDGCATGWKGAACNQRDDNIKICDGVKGEDYHEECHTCVNTDESYTCMCRDGYELDQNTQQRCIDINECSGKRGVDYDQDCHTCENTPGGYECKCHAGYELDTSTGMSCRDINECQVTRRIDIKQTCHSCVNVIGGYTCLCKTGFELDLETRQECIDIDECKGKAGQDFDIDCHTCVNLVGSYTCQCDTSFQLDPRTNRACQPIKSTTDSGLDEKSSDARAPTSTPKPPSSIPVDLIAGTVIGLMLAIAVVTASVLFIRSCLPSEIPIDDDSTGRGHDNLAVRLSDANVYETIGPSTELEEMPYVKVESQIRSGMATFYAFQWSSDGDVAKFWRLVKDKEIQNVVLLEDVSSEIVPAVGSSMEFDFIKVAKCEQKEQRGQQARRLKMFSVKVCDGKQKNEEFYINQHLSVNVLTVDQELTNKIIIQLRKGLIGLNNAVVCKSGHNLDGFFIGVYIILDMVDEGKEVDVLHAMQPVKAVYPTFAPTKTQLVQLSHLEEDYRKYGE